MTRDQMTAHLILHGWDAVYIRSERVPSLMRPHPEGMIEVFTVEHAQGVAVTSTIWAKLDRTSKLYPSRYPAMWDAITPQRLDAMAKFVETMNGV